jgi:hypothetical protein
VAEAAVEVAAEEEEVVVEEEEEEEAEVPAEEAAAARPEEEVEAVEARVLQGSDCPVRRCWEASSPRSASPLHRSRQEKRP